MRKKINVKRMNKQVEMDKRYLRMAFIWSENSYAIRRKVGALIVNNGMIVSDGYNGTPSGFPNVCEYAVCPDDEGKSYCNAETREELIQLQANGWRLITYPCVLHAESNAITKLAKIGESANGGTIYITDAPCPDCSKLIIQAGIKRVVYAREYRNTDGVDLLRKAGIEVICYDLQENENVNEKPVIYIVCEIYNCNDDESYKNVIATFSRESAEAKINELKDQIYKRWDIDDSWSIEKDLPGIFEIYDSGWDYHYTVFIEETAFES